MLDNDLIFYYFRSMNNSKPYCIIISIVALSLFSCDRNKINTNRITSLNNYEHYGEWDIVELYVDGVKDSVSPYWYLPNCEDIYTDSCTGTWKNSQNPIDSTPFYWQFSEKGQKFTLSRKSLPSDTLFAANNASHQCYDYSGEYEVLTRRRKLMRFQSYTTVGFSGKLVEIEIRR